MRHVADSAAWRGMSAVVVLAALFAALLPGAALAQTGPDVRFLLSGLDALQPGVEGRVAVATRLADRGGLLDGEPLRIVGTLTSGGQPAQGVPIAYELPGGGTSPTTTDSQGRFFFPPASQPPLTIGSTPALLSTQGFEQGLRLALGDGNHTFTVRLVATGEDPGTVVRHAGSGRVQTAVEISRANFLPGVPVVFVATQGDFPDALTGGPGAAVLGGPLLLVSRTSIPDATAGELRRLTPGRIVILGGNGVVGPEVADALRSFTAGAVDRLSGPNRFDTAANIAIALFGSSRGGTVYVATGDNFADALSGGPAATLENAPMLLLQRDSIPGATADALRLLAPSRIVILGGGAAVSTGVEAQLAAFAAQVVRFSGPDRFATSAEISRQSFDPANVSVVYIATGASFPDALSGVPVAGRRRAPMLLVNAGSIPPPVLVELQRLRPARIVVLGGSAVVSAAVFEQLRTLTAGAQPNIATAASLGSPASASATLVEPEPSPSPTPTPTPTPTATPTPTPTPTVTPEGASVAITAPLADTRRVVRPGRTFSLSFTTDQAGTFDIEAKPATAGDDAFAPLPFTGGTGNAALTTGPETRQVTAPATFGEYTLRVRLTNQLGVISFSPVVAGALAVDDVSIVLDQLAENLIPGGEETFRLRVSNPTTSTVEFLRQEVLVQLPDGVPCPSDTSTVVEVVRVGANPPSQPVPTPCVNPSASTGTIRLPISFTGANHETALFEVVAGGSVTTFVTFVLENVSTAAIDRFNISARLVEAGVARPATAPQQVAVSPQPSGDPITVTLASDGLGTRRTDGDRTLVASVKGAGDVPITGAHVLFEIRSVSGAPDVDGSAFTDGDGLARFTYGRSEDGQDIVTVCTQADGRLPSECTLSDVVYPSAPGTAVGLQNAQSIDPDRATAAFALAQSLAGPGVTVQSATLTGDMRASGLFGTGASAINLEQGLVLSTGRALDLAGPNNSTSTTTRFGVPGNESGLQSLAGAGAALFDIAALEFTFEAAAPRATFDFVFGSEEYPEFVPEEFPFNDVFGLFYTQDGTRQNCAVTPTPPAGTPGTIAADQPISIKTINSGMNQYLFRSNPPFSSPFNVEVDGFTRVLRCQLTITPNTPVTVKFAIADVGDDRWDSAAFIGALSTLVSVQETVDWLFPDGIVQGVLSRAATDSTAGGVEPGRAVRLTQNGVTRETITATATHPNLPEGTFVFPDVYPGNYTLSVTEPFFEPFSTTITVNPGQTTTRDITITPTPPGPPATITLTPNTQTLLAPTAVDRTRVVTATVRDAGGRPVADGTDVRFEVFENDPASSTGARVGYTTAPTQPVPRILNTINGVATFAYTFPDVVLPSTGRLEGKDLVVVCVVPEGSTDRCVPAESVTYDSALDNSEAPPERRPIGIDPDKLSSYTRTTWQLRRATTLTIDEAARATTRLADSVDNARQQAVPAEVLDQFGDPVENVDLRLTVFRQVSPTLFTPDEHKLASTDADGRTVFTYEGPDVDGADRVRHLVVCDTQTPQCVTGGGDLTLDGSGNPTNLDTAGRLVTHTTTRWVRVQRNLSAALSWANVVVPGPVFGAVSDEAARADALGTAELALNATAGVLCWDVSYTGPGSFPADDVDGGLPAFIGAGSLVQLGSEHITLGQPAQVSPGVHATADCATGLTTQLTQLNDAVAAAASGDLVDFFVRVPTLENRSGEVRGQLGRNVTDGGASRRPPVFRMVDVPLAATSPQQLELTFSEPVQNPSLAGLGIGHLEGSDFAVTVNGEQVPVDVVGAPPRWTPAAITQVITLPGTFLAEGDVVSVSITPAGAQKICDVPCTNGDAFRDLTKSVLTRGFTAESLVSTVVITNDVAAPLDAEVVAGEHIRFRTSGGLAQDVRVLVRDQFDDLMVGHEVVAQAFGPGALTPAQVTATTGDDGVAVFTEALSKLELRDAEEGYTLQFCADGVCDTSDPFAVRPGRIATIDVLEQPEAVTTAGMAILGADGGSVTIRATDQFSNATPDRGIRVRALLPETGSIDQLFRPRSASTGVSITGTTNDNGIVSFPAPPALPANPLIVFRSGEDYVLTFTALNQPGTVVVGTSDEFEIVPDVPADVAIVNAVAAPPGGKAVAGEHITFRTAAGAPEDARVRVRDQYENPIPGETVSADGSPALADPASAETGSDGEAVFTDTVGSRLAIKDADEGATLTFEVDTLTATSDAFEIIAAGPDATQSSVDAVGIEPGRALLTIDVADEFGNPVTGLGAGSFTGRVNNGTPAAFNTSLFPDFNDDSVTGVPGRYTVQYANAAGSYELDITAVGVLLVDDLPVVLSGPPANRVFDPAPADLQATLAPLTGAGGGDVRVRVRDSSNVPVPGVVVNYDLLDDGGAPYGAGSATTGSDGRATITATVADDPGTHTLRVNVGGLPQLTTTFDVATPGAPDSSAFVAAVADPQVAGAALVDEDDESVRVLVLDAFGDPVVGEDVGYTLTGPSGVVASGTVQTDGDGIATIVEDNGTEPGTHTLLVQVAGVSPDLSVDFEVEPAAPDATMSSLTGPATPQTAGVALTGILATVTDEFGNAIQGQAVTLEIRTVADPGTVYASFTDTTDSNGEADFAGEVITDADNYTATLLVDGVEFGGPNAFTVEPADPDSVTFDAAPAAEQTGGTELVDASPSAAPLTVTVTDEFDNAIPNGTVTFEILDGAVVVDTQGATITDGAAAVPATLLAPLVAGSYTLRVVVDGTAPEVEATAPFLVALGFEDAGGVVAGAQTVSTDLVAVDVGPIRVRLLDAAGNPDDGETVTADLVSGSGALTGTLSQPTDIDGVATFGNLQVDAEDTYEIRFTVGARTIVVTFDAAP